MKGVIFKQFEAFIVERFGDQVFEQILDRTTLETQGPFVGPATYPDSDLFALVATAIEMAGLELDAALFAFGDFLYERLAASIPGIVAAHSDVRSLLLALDRVIHVEVRKLMTDAETPRIACEETGPDSLRVTYRSSRKLCPLFLGLLNAAARSFGQRVQHDELACMHRGADACVFELRFSSAAAIAA
ncbi:MAG: heme NO-binding domain-containing protein [Planctomycetota bacterium]